MNNLIEFEEKPAPGKFMIAGWHQWADAGDVSSGLPQYLIENTGAKKIGQIKPNAFYLFQIPGTHHLLRPEVKLDEGYPKELRSGKNDFFYSGDDTQGFLIFYGQEPHQNEERYAKAFLDAIEALGVKRVAAVAGVYGAMPYDKDRRISCVYSLPEMKDELTEYVVSFSNYKGGATISMYLADKAKLRGIEFFRFCAFVPSYNFSQVSTLIQPIAIEEDFKAWYDLMTRLNHMFGLNMDLSDLEKQSNELISEWDAKIDQIARTMPQLRVRDYMEKVNSEFSEMSFEPLSDIWEDALGHLFDDT
jgi:predicted ATP-grasp superfamily ATP-dependent carboligase